MTSAARIVQRTKNDIAVLEAEGKRFEPGELFAFFGFCELSTSHPLCNAPNGSGITMRSILARISLESLECFSVACHLVQFVDDLGFDCVRERNIVDERGGFFGIRIGERPLDKVITVLPLAQSV